MPWRSAMEEKNSFIMEWMAEGSSVTELCRAYGISRTLGYRYIDRYLESGREGLEERSRAPRRIWNKTPESVEDLVVSIRLVARSSGGQGIWELLNGSVDAAVVPSVSTISLILKRHGLVKKRRRVRRIREVHPIFRAGKPNEIWSADFKGKFRTGDGQYCYPLTVMDTYSRYLLGVVALPRPTSEATKAVFVRLFEEFGLPAQIHTDNGEPFASAVSLSRLTHLAVWFIDLEIVPVYSDPGHPEQNGKHERMHKELKEQATRPAASNIRSQQRKLEEFRRVYNEARPRKSLNGHTPQELYYRSARNYEEPQEQWEYPPEFEVKYVCRNGAIRWHHQSWITVSTTLMEKHIGLEKIAEGLWRVYYRDMLLGYLDEKQMRVLDDAGRYMRAQPKV
jgi:transposase InsO family protein